MLVATGRQTYPDDHAFVRRGDLPCWTLELTYSGTLLRRTGPAGRFRPQPNGVLLLTPPATPYALRGQQGGEEVWLIFDPRPELRECLDWPIGCCGIPELPIPRTPQGRQALQALEDTHHYWSARLPRRHLLAENALERLLLLAGELRSANSPAVDERIQRTLDLIHAPDTGVLTVPQLARSAGLSPSRFAHLFRRETGVSPIRYLEDVRMEHARTLLLRTDLPIQDIAARVGFADPFYFSTRFRRRFGRCPTAWRNQPVSR